MRGFKHVFDVFTPERKYHLVADNEMEKRDWIETLNTTLFTLPPSHPHTPTPPQDSKQQQQHQVRHGVKKTFLCLLINLTPFSSHVFISCNICCFCALIL